ncbi:MAG TPA: YeeE/YedE family protein [Acidobacteriota bacterium]|nr:YeeE/YedE family protein [Acidobacteriota bacterium]
MAEVNLTGGLIGGALIGLAAALLLLFNGRIAGVSGILGGIFTSDNRADRLWRCAFVIGIIFGAALYARVFAALAVQIQANNFTLIVAGILVGFGTRLGSGCTSGHGVCGLARRSPRSIVATATFMLLGMLTVFLMRHVSF